jgi:hypothetical protein
MPMGTTRAPAAAVKLILCIELGVLSVYRVRRAAFKTRLALISGPRRVGPLGRTDTPSDTRPRNAQLCVTLQSNPKSDVFFREEATSF